MSAGELKQRVTLQSQERNPDAPGWSSGEGSMIWSDYAIVWARIDHLSGNEQFTAGAIYENVVIKVTTRRFPELISSTKPYRFIWNEEAYKVKEIDSTAKRGYLISTCEKTEK